MTGSSISRVVAAIGPGGDYPGLDADGELRVISPGGHELFAGPSNDCFAFLLRAQGQSVSYALADGGWRVEAVR